MKNSTLDLAPNQTKALIKLAAGSGDDEAAQAAGVTVRSIQNWKKQPNFKSMLRQAVIATYDAAIAELVDGAKDAAKELKGIITDPDTPKRVKVSAIATLLEVASKAKQTMLEERLERLEGIVDGDEPSQNQED
ncbi:MAG TPA: hypothetical protein DCL61_04700 [Cyanobacteria bacterium UBA12227]|nr:hypothetical protein [Cyanobacteria bacterium UBA12227]